MSTLQIRLLMAWTALLSSVVCLGFLPVSRLVSALILLVLSGLILLVWHLTPRRTAQGSLFQINGLPEASYRQPVVLVCGDLPQTWPAAPVLVVSQGCWIRVGENQDPAQVGRQLLSQRPDWGRQLSVMVSICPQQHDNSELLASQLLTLRWQISQLHRDTRHTVPLLLNVQIGNSMINAQLWQTAVPGDRIGVWHGSSAPGFVSPWVTTGGTMPMHQQVLMNSLIAWCHQYACAAFMDKHPDIPVITPTIMLWGNGPTLSGSLTSSVWTDWLVRHTAMQRVTGWSPAETDSTGNILPDFVLPLLPQGQGLTLWAQTRRYASDIFMLAVIAALLCSGWNNRQLLHRLSFDITRYEQFSMGDRDPKAAAIAVLHQHAAQLDDWARNGVPLRMSLGLYHGEGLRLPVLEAIRSYASPILQPQPLSPTPTAKPMPAVVRLDSMSLFDSGKYALKTSSTRLLVNSLVGIKANPGWLIVVAGHTDSIGNPQLNQTLSLKRAGAVRDWIRENSDIPDSCFAVQGYGAAHPVATNETPKGRAQNRRVEIRLVPQADACRVPDITSASSQDDGALITLMEK
ncbi:OmpA family protein [Enterobacter bugandensis]|nr:OmpA family protein [Enterobacter bugandensis]